MDGEQPENHGEWKDSHERILREWKAVAFINLWLHTTSSYYYAKIHDMLTYPVIVFTSVSSAALFMGTDSNVLKYMVSAVTLLSSVLTVVTRQMRPGELYQEYSNMAKRYSALIRHVHTCLDLPMELRMPPDKFIDKIQMEIETLSTTQMFPPLCVMRLFEKKFGSIEKKMFGDDIAELLQQDIETMQQERRIRRASTIFSQK